MTATRQSIQLHIVRRKHQIRAWFFTIIAALTIGITTGLVIRAVTEPDASPGPPPVTMTTQGTAP